MKAPLYAAARVPERWIVNVVAGCIEVYREPSDLRSAYGNGFAVREEKPLEPANSLPEPDVVSTPGTSVGWRVSEFV